MNRILESLRRRLATLLDKRPQRPRDDHFEMPTDPEGIYAHMMSNMAISGRDPAVVDDLISYLSEHLAIYAARGSGFMLYAQLEGRIGGNLTPHYLLIDVCRAKIRERVLESKFGTDQVFRRFMDEIDFLVTYANVPDPHRVAPLAVHLLWLASEMLHWTAERILMPNAKCAHYMPTAILDYRPFLTELPEAMFATEDYQTNVDAVLANVEWLKTNLDS